MNKHLIFFLFVISIALPAFADQTHGIIPLPVKVEALPGDGLPTEHITVTTDDDRLRSVAALIRATLNERKAPDGEGVKNNVALSLALSPKVKHSEGYVLSVDGATIHIEGATPAGVFYGFQTLRQMLWSNDRHQGRGLLAPVRITDEPRFAWRGFMLDESRHFFGREKVKQILDLMALHKLNVFHWHLTDEPGWRIEIKKYPELTRTGATGNYTDATSPPRFYTQDEIIEIVRYAADRFIQVIPEIDMPGHASAAVRAYPHLSGGGSDKHPDFTFNPGKEETYGFLADVLREVKQIFPAPYIHVGGDEVHYGNQEWEVDPFVTQLMKTEKLKDTKAVEYYFINRMNDTIQSIGKTLIGWDEVIQSGVSPRQSMVMWWRHDKPEALNEALDKGYDVVLCPRIPLYFDFVQHADHKTGRRWGSSFCTLEDVYNFPEGLGAVANHVNIKGLQANMWTERFSTPAALDFMLWPRLSAFAESAWSGSSVKDFPAFEERLRRTMFPIYDAYGLNYFNEGGPLGLKFNSEGWFKIVQFTDTHVQPANPASDAVYANISCVLDAEKPGFVVFTGDVVTGRPVEEGWRKTLQPVIDRGIPFTVLFGNHDDEQGVGREQLAAIVAQMPGCIFVEKVENVTGYGNQVIEVRSSDGAIPAAMLYCMDSNAYTTIEGVGKYGWFTDDQIGWYRCQSAKYAITNGKPLPALAFFHIPLPEYKEAWNNTKHMPIGNRLEDECSPAINTGMFAAMLECGDVMGAFVGHDHDNDYVACLYGIALAYGRFSGGKTTYGDLTNGARVIMLKEGQRSFRTWIRTSAGEVIDEIEFPTGFIPAVNK